MGGSVLCLPGTAQPPSRVLWHLGEGIREPGGLEKGLEKASKSTDSESQMGQAGRDPRVSQVPLPAPAGTPQGWTKQ